MSKKNYSKPTMRVYKLQHQPRLLDASHPDARPRSYIPGIDNDEMNRLA